MPRIVNVAAAQLGPIQKADTRQAVVARMLDLMDRPRPRAATSSSIPSSRSPRSFRAGTRGPQRGRHLVRARDAERRDAAAVRGGAAQHGMAMSFGYAELTPDGHHFNTSILVDRDGRRSSASTARCTCPAMPSSIPSARHQHLEKRYFEPGDLGFPVWRMLGGIFGMCICNDRRWPETSIASWGCRASR